MRLTATNSVHSFAFSDEYWQANYQGGSSVSKGSSGGALLNENNQIVGQLLGGWSTCTFHLSDRYGKFSKSWTGGSTNDSRLSNWLSPVQNLSSMNLFDPTTVSIQGNDAVGCVGTTQYSLSNNLFDVNYLWTVTTNLQIISGQGTSAITVSRVVDGTGTITVSVTSNEGYNRNLLRTKQVQVGLPISVSFTQKTITCVNTKPYFFGAVAVVSGATNYAWYSKDESNPNNPFVLRQSENSNTADFPLGNNHGNRYYTIRVVVNASCGNSQTTIQTIDADGYIYAPPCSGFRAIASPNPTTNNITVQIVNESGLQSGEMNIKFYELQLIDKTGIILKQYKYNGVSQATIDLSDLRSGIYLLRLWDGKEWASTEIIKN